MKLTKGEDLIHRAARRTVLDFPNRIMVSRGPRTLAEGRERIDSPQSLTALSQARQRFKHRETSLPLSKPALGERRW